MHGLSVHPGGNEDLYVSNMTTDALCGAQRCPENGTLSWLQDNVARRPVEGISAHLPL
ncbi:hypothetical protein MARINON1_50691 [Marinobacter salarius]|nr:hypothetical protein MBHK15_130919 [Marinobacter salarius]VXB53779.1 hypothetical protein MARINON1_50691 [Marinobacter salarius]